MARIRSIKPEFWTDSKVVRLGPYARLLFQGMWNFAVCDQGHLDDDAFALKLKVLPADQVDAVELLEEVIGSGMVARRTMTDGRTYLHVVHLADHSKVDTRWSSRCPYCSHEASVDLVDHNETPSDSPSLTETPASLTEPQRNSTELNGTHHRGGEGEGEVKGGCARDSGEPERATPQPPPVDPDPQPPTDCPRHPGGTERPCRACADARRSHDAWQRRQRDRPTPVPRTPACPIHPDQPTGSKRCRKCSHQERRAGPGDVASLRETVRAARRSLE